MGRIEIQPPVDWRSMTKDEKLAWARTAVEVTRVAYEAEPDEA